MNEIDSKTMAAIKSMPSTTLTWLGGYRVDIGQNDEKFYMELDKAKKVVDTESSLSEKDRVFRDALIVLLGHVEIKTTKIDELLTKLKEM